MRTIYIIIAGILTSFYLFPFEFAFLPGVNTKMAMAGASLVILLFRKATGRESAIDKNFLVLSIIAMVFSLQCLTAVVVNGTSDYTYTTFIVSMWVWLGGAYTLTSYLRKIHGSLSVKVVFNYLITVCVFQCIMALVIDAVPEVRDWVNSTIQGFDFVELDRLGGSERLYGIGAALDVAGIRFSVALIVITYMVMNLDYTVYEKYLPLYIIAFLTVALVGNMIARTTTVGLVLSIFLWIFYAIKDSGRDKNGKRVSWVILILVVGIINIVHKYNVDSHFRDQVTFAFEGFFSLAETGTWDVSSNNNLKNMIVFPETLKTWLIGDGYIENPRATDPYYVGPYYRGYYMGTDIGYLRIIFYAGIFALFAFIFFFYKTAGFCVQKFPEYKTVFWLILLVNYIVWLKVATDVFVIFALFLCISAEENAEADKMLYIDQEVSEE